MNLLERKPEQLHYLGECVKIVKIADGIAPQQACLRDSSCDCATWMWGGPNNVHTALSML